MIIIHNFLYNTKLTQDILKLLFLRKFNKKFVTSKFTETYLYNNRFNCVSGCSLKLVYIEPYCYKKRFITQELTIGYH